MGSQQQKKARALAYKAATNQALWQKGKAELLGSKWYYPLKYRLFKKFRAQVDQAIGTWYKANLKGMADQAVNQIHDPAYKEMIRARRKIRKMDRKKSARLYWDQIRMAKERLKDIDDGNGSVGSDFGEYMKEQEVEVVMQNLGLSGQEK